MATARMRHHNSPEEIAKRQGAATPEGNANPRVFRHYNSPEEVAKRAGQAPPAAPVVPSRRVIETTARPAPPADWPPRGQSNNAPVPPPPAAPAAVALVAAAVPAAPATPAPGSSLSQRLTKLEVLVASFIESAAEAAEFRRLLNNQAAVTDSQRDIVNRIRAIEEVLADLAEGDDDIEAEGDDDIEDDGADHGDTEPPPPPTGGEST